MSEHDNDHHIPSYYTHRSAYERVVRMNIPAAGLVQPTPPPLPPSTIPPAEDIIPNSRLLGSVHSYASVDSSELILLSPNVRRPQAFAKLI